MKKITLTLVLALVLTLALVSCSGEPKTTTINDEEILNSEIASTNDAYTLIEIIEIENNLCVNNLVYDLDTKIVYYYFSDTTTRTHSRAYMCPYYSAQGNLCCYNVETKMIEEIK